MKNLREAGIAVHSSRQERENHREVIFVSLFPRTSQRVEHRGGLGTRYQPEGWVGSEAIADRMRVRCIARRQVGGGWAPA